MATKAVEPAAATAASEPSGDLPPRRSAELLDSAAALDKRKEKCGESRQRGGENEGEDESREAKRRRTNRQLSLEKPPANSSAEGSGSRGNGPADFSFSFDARIAATPIETTPKFGSFNFSLDLAGFAADSNNEKGEEEDDTSATEAADIDAGEGKTGI